MSSRTSTPIQHQARLQQRREDQPGSCSWPRSGTPTTCSTTATLDGDIGSDGSTPQARANAAGFKGVVAETVAINPALAINGVEIMNQWYYRPDYMAIMSNCANTQMGVWSAN